MCCWFGLQIKTALQKCRTLLFLLLLTDHGYGYFCWCCHTVHEHREDCLKIKTLEMLNRLYCQFSEAEENKGCFKEVSDHSTQASKTGRLTEACGGSDAREAGLSCAIQQSAHALTSLERRRLDFHPVEHVHVRHQYSGLQQASSASCEQTVITSSLVADELRRLIKLLIAQYQEALGKIYVKAACIHCGSDPRLAFLNMDEWLDCGYSGYKEFLKNSQGKNENPLWNDKNYKKVKQMIQYLPGEEKERRWSVIHTEYTTPEEKYYKVAIHLFQSLMTFFQYHTQNCSVIQLTTNWNPDNFCTHCQFPQASLIHHFTADRASSNQCYRSLRGNILADMRALREVAIKIIPEYRRQQF